MKDFQKLCPAPRSITACALWPLVCIVLLPWFGSAFPTRAQDFSTSRIEILSGAPVAGDLVRYRIDLLHTGAGEVHAEVSLAAPGGVLVSLAGDCAGTAVTEDVAWVLERWQPGEARYCLVEVFTYAHSAGANAVLQADIRSGASFHRVESSVLLASPASGPSAFFTFAFAGIGGAVALVWAFRQSIGGKKRRREDGALLVAAIGIAFLGIFADMARDDWRAAFHFEETTCRVIGVTFDIGTGPRNHRTSSTTYSPRLALAYEVGGKAMVSSGFATQSSILIGNAADMSAFSFDSTIPCRFDPDHPKTVLVRCSPGLAYLFACLPLGLIVLAVRFGR